MYSNISISSIPHNTYCEPSAPEADPIPYEEEQIEGAVSPQVKSRLIFDSLRFSKDYKLEKNNLLNRADSLNYVIRNINYASMKVMLIYLIMIIASAVILAFTFTLGIDLLIMACCVGSIVAWGAVCMMIVDLGVYLFKKSLYNKAAKIYVYNDFQEWQKIRKEAQGMNLETLSRVHTLERVKKYALLEDEEIIRKIANAQTPRL